LQSDEEDYSELDDDAQFAEERVRRIEVLAEGRTVGNVGDLAGHQQVCFSRVVIFLLLRNLSFSHSFFLYFFLPATKCRYSRRAATSRKSADPCK